LPDTGPDYDGFGCPTPPYIVLSYDGTAWGRVPLTELPARFWKGNLLGYYGAERGWMRSVRTTRASIWAALTAASGIHCR